MRVTYNSNNSGGNWWLDDDDWLALEAAGWLVQWGGPRFYCDYGFYKPPAGLTKCRKGTLCHGHQAALSAAEAGSRRCLGALATKATREGLSLKDAIAEWEEATGQDSSALGCSCCGVPHFFGFEGDNGEREYYSPTSDD